MASVDFWNAVAFNANAYIQGELADASLGVGAGQAQSIGACSSGLIGSGRSILSSYIIPPETWLVLTTEERRRNWVTPLIPPDVSLQCWNRWDTPRLAYVREYNWEKRGARGMFAVDHYGSGNFNIRFVIGRPISPSLYIYINKKMGESGANFAILARNTHWVSAVIGAFDNQQGKDIFWVHYNDNGRDYRRIKLPYETFTDYMQTLIDGDVAAISWPDTEAHTVTLGDTTPLTTGPTNAPASTGMVPDEAQSLLASPDAPGTSTDAPLINETFAGVDLTRFWPQFMVALEIALFSPVASEDLLNELATKPHWVAIEQYMNSNRGSYRWVPPTYAEGSLYGKADKPDYLSK